MTGSEQHLPKRGVLVGRLAIASAVNQFGNWIADVALAVLVFSRTGSELATTALFVSLGVVPALLGPPLAARVEVIPARRALPAIHVAEAVVFVALSILASHFSLPAILALGVIDGALAIAASAMTRAATAASLASGEALRQGNAIINMGTSFGGAAGPAVGGVIVAALGSGPALLVDAGTFVLVAVILATTRGLRVVPNEAQNWKGRLRLGLAETRARPALRGLMLGFSGSMLLFTTVIPIEVAYVTRTLHGNATAYGLFLGAWGVGTVLGSLAYAGALRARLLLLLAVSTVVLGAGYAGIALAGGLLIACAFSTIGGIGNGGFSPAIVTSIQQSVPQSSQATVMALFKSMDLMVPGLGFLLGGVIATLSSPRVTYAVAAAGIIPMLLVVLTLPRASMEQGAAELGTALEGDQAGEEASPALVAADDS